MLLQKNINPFDYIDIEIFKLFCRMMPNDRIQIGNKMLECVAVKPMVKLVLRYGGERISLSYAFGNWYTCLKANHSIKNMPKQLRVYNSLLRDLEGLLIVDMLNRNNPLHTPICLN